MIQNTIVSIIPAHEKKEIELKSNIPENIEFNINIDLKTLRDLFEIDIQTEVKGNRVEES